MDARKPRRSVSLANIGEHDDSRPSTTKKLEQDPPHRYRKHSKYIPRVPSMASINVLFEASKLKKWRERLPIIRSLSFSLSPTKAASAALLSRGDPARPGRFQYWLTSVILLLSGSAGRDKCSGLLQHSLQLFATVLAKNSYEDPVARIRMLMMQGFAGSLSNARKVLRFGRWLDEYEKIKYVVWQMGGNQTLRAATAVAHVFSFFYYLLDNYIYIMKVQLTSMQNMGKGTKYDPDIESVLRLNASTKMAGVYNYTKTFTQKLVYWTRVRNMCSLTRILLALGVEFCRLYELGIEVQRAEASMESSETLAELRAKRSTSILKLVQDGSSFMKLCAAFGGALLLPNVSDSQAACFGVINCALGIWRNWPKTAVIESQRNYFNQVGEAKPAPKAKQLVDLGASPPVASKSSERDFSTTVVYATEPTTISSPT
eukprot:TRINITY_DN27595_c0_g1_i1.p1 TRINITY_DN27595_c0_g1~~TRINITY_DN27595_c0_g1_i1.p1  ORF type:complete len:430 (-),score=63.83 TRINITY_DN27595_c0_g1_i1:236-1525(-)